MANSGHGLQVVNVLEDHSYELNIPELEKLLYRDEIKDLPLVVVSVAGAYRGGKSFLLNFFIRYLNSSAEARQDDSWLGENSEPLTGFTWRSGVERTTTGILMWSEPFITTLPNGNKMAVLLMDTQGTFDNVSTVRDCSTIFALSTLLSSVQIYNLSLNIQEDDLQNLQLFAEYGRMAKNEGSKAFQVLEFLVRDWQFAEDYPYGEVGGEKLLEERFKLTPKLPKEMQELRQHIRSCFEKVSCFLLPHPGFKVLKKKFSGKISDIDEEFRTYLIKLVKSIFGPEKLLAKAVNGNVKARDMFNYFKTYMDLFNSGEIPSPTSIMEATVKAGLLSIQNEAREVYEKEMDADCGPQQPNYPTADLQVLHSRHMTAAREFFEKKKKLGSIELAHSYRDELTEELEQRLPQFMQINLAKVQASISKAKEAYEEAVKRITRGHPLCVHPLDVEKIHRAGISAAIEVFDSTRKRVTDPLSSIDDERSQFINGAEKQLSVLTLSNEQSNTIAVSTLRMDYWQFMQSKCLLDPPLSEGSLKGEHQGALNKALQAFESKRNIPNSYSEDTFKYRLTTGIASDFAQLQTLNKSATKAKDLQEAGIQMTREIELEMKRLEAQIAEQNRKIVELQNRPSGGGGGLICSIL